MTAFGRALPSFALVATSDIVMLVAVVVASLALCWFVMQAVLRETVSASRKLLPRDETSQNADAHAHHDASQGSSSPRVDGGTNRRD